MTWGPEINGLEIYIYINGFTGVISLLQVEFITLTTLLISPITGRGPHFANSNINNKIREAEMPEKVE